MADILGGKNCLNKLGTANGASGCAHDLGFLVVKAYKKLAAEMGEDYAFDVYMAARLRLKNSAVTPASLHRNVADILEEQAPHLVTAIGLPVISDPFDLPNWEEWLDVYSIVC
ncbi:MAG: hypothetical protein OXH68_05900 [Gammaproteobacteria bacterium]|nr:hypothetical protein [Gammaproteobacteria bacterium]